MVRRSRPPGWIRRLLPWVAAHRRKVLLAFAAALVGSALNAVVPAVEQVIIDDVILHHRQPLWLWLGVLIAAAILTFGAAHIRRYVGGRVSLDIQYDLRNAIYDQLQRLDFARHDELQTGQLVSRANSDVGLLQALLSFLPMMSGNLVMMVVSLAIMFWYSPLLATISLVVLPAMAVSAYRMREKTFPASWDGQQKEGEVATLVEEAVTGVRVVKGFGQEQWELDHLIGRASTLYASRLRAVRLQARYQPILQAIPVLGQVAVLALGGWMAIHHQLTIGTFLAFATYLLALAAPARMLATLLLVAQQARAGAERVLDLLASTPRVAEAPDAQALPPARGDLRLRGVKFGYLSRRPVLDGFDLHVAPGETVALVGASGSGKSTVALLVPRFYDVQSGAVEVDGIDVRRLQLDSLRSQIGVVFEESFLFSDTVAANIAYGRPDATPAEIEAAARAAEAHDFITALPAGYETTVGERGLSLSGGQRQRIALARALITDPRIMLLDDATSAVDARVEEEIHATLRRVMSGRTTVLVAHRRSTLRLADRIVVVDAGRVLDQGSHQELVSRCPLYRQLLAGPDLAGPDLGAGPDLVGPGLDAAPDLGERDLDGVVAPALLDGEAVPAPPGSVTPEAWPELDPAGASSTGGGVTSAALSGAAHGAGHGAGHGNWLGALAPTPELLAKVEALPPATDRPEIEVAEQTEWDPTFTLRRFLRPFSRPLAMGLLLVILDAVATLAGPMLIRSGLDAGVEHHSLEALWVASAAFLVVTALDYIDSIAQVMVTGRTAERLLFALRVRIWAQLQRLGIDFYEREMAGRIMTRMTTDIDALSNLLQSGLINALVALFTFAGVGVALVFMNWMLGLITMSVVVPLAFATVAYRRLSARAYATARERIAVVNANLQESLSGVREAQAFVRRERNQREFRRLAGSYLTARVGAQRLVAIYFPFVEFLADIGAVLVLGVGSVLIARHSLSAGGLIAFLLYLDLFFNPVQQLSQTFDSYQQAGASMAQINALMTVPTTTPPPAQPAAPWPVRGEVALRDVHFTYPGGAGEALVGVNLVVPAGQTVALVGETGAGKSTIVKLMVRFYDPTSGRVTLDGRDVAQLDPTWFRHRLGYVPQEAFLFSGSIRDNIAYGRPGATDAEVEAAARAVGAHDLVASLPGGYRHVVSERGRSLSAGQRQLIALARAELLDPRVLLLDEATSNLDLATEARVSRAMGVVASGRTTVLIAHRLPTAARADRVIVVDGGRVVEDGSHAELLAAGGAYARMWEASEVGSPQAA
jgi:ATP-binding cassette subfamily B protein